MDPREAVQLLRHKDRVVEAIRGLVGGVTASELRSIDIGPDVRNALINGATDPDARIRWWCIQLLDHLPETAALDAIAAALDDPVPRVRRNAAHALDCTACKPGWDGDLPDRVMAKLTQLATTDTNAKVRAVALSTLACRSTKDGEP